MWIGMLCVEKISVTSATYGMTFLWLFFFSSLFSVVVGWLAKDPVWQVWSAISMCLCSLSFSSVLVGIFSLTLSSVSDRMVRLKKQILVCVKDLDLAATQMCSVKTSTSLVLILSTSEPVAWCYSLVGFKFSAFHFLLIDDAQDRWEEQWFTYDPTSQF